MFRIDDSPVSPLASKLLTTGDAARVCRVAPRTVTKWVDRGLIAGSYRLPVSTDRRISAVGLREFMVKHDMAHLVPPQWGAEILLCGLTAVQGRGFENTIARAVPDDAPHLRFRFAGGPLAVAYAALYQPVLALVGAGLGWEIIQAIPEAVKLSPFVGARTYTVLVVGEHDGINPARAMGEYVGVDAAVYGSRYTESDQSPAVVQEMRGLLVETYRRWQSKD